MNTPLSQRRLERNWRRIEEIRAWRDVRLAPLTSATFQASPEHEARSVSIGDPWPEMGLPVTIDLESAVPADFAGQPVELELWLGGEGFAEITFDDDVAIKGAIDPYHFQYPLTREAKGGEPIRVHATVVPRALFGSPIEHPRVERAVLVVPAQPLRDLDRDLTVAWQTARVLSRHDHEIVPRLLDVIEETMAVLSQVWPTETETTLNRLLIGQEEAAGSGVFAAGVGFAEHARLFSSYRIGGRWSTPSPTGPMAPPSDQMIDVVEQARATLASGIDRLRHDYPPIGNIALTGHAHIDLAWLWPVAETRRKVRRTGWSVINLMDEYPDFVHNQSSGQVYAWMEEDDPELLERVKQRAAEGRWDPVGGMWCEPDNQLTGGEAMVRQALYGQREFERHFGRRSTIAWLPDSFGFSAGLPQILAGAGLTSFFTHKMTWNEENVFPWDLFEWEGLDGTRVLAHQFRNQEEGASGYNGEIHPKDVYGTWKRFVGKRQHDESLLAFGLGDGGGGPSRQSLENYARIKSYPVLPELRMSTVEDYFAGVPRDHLPVWIGEMYLELHRGTLTSQARTKKLNRDAEQGLAAAEVLSSLAMLLGGAYPQADLNAAWKVLLLNQFHDILPGSSIHEVYEETEPELTKVVQEARQMRDTAFGDGQRGTWRVSNTLLGERPLSVIVPGVQAATGSSGEPLPSQQVEGGLLVYSAAENVPGLGWTTITAGPATGVPIAPADGGVTAWQDGGLIRIENSRVQLAIGADGTIHEARFKADDRAIFSDRGNQLWAYTDKPRGWDAWDIDEFHEAQGTEIVASEPPVIVEAGPVRAAVRVTRRWHGSTIVQTYRLLADSPLIEVDNEIDWHERQVLLKAQQPFNIRAHEASFETMYGTVRRPTHRNTSWEWARFEVAGHRFADLSEGSFGVAVVNDGRYGHGLDTGRLSLSLLRSPLDPDMLADEGHHAFRYGILPHRGSLSASDVVAKAHAFNAPLVAAPSPVSADATDATWSLVDVTGLRVALGALKKAEESDDLILRIHEPHGDRGSVTLAFAIPLEGVSRVNLLEDTLEDLTMQDGAVTIDIRPYEIVSLRLRRAEALQDS